MVLGVHERAVTVLTRTAAVPRTSEKLGVST